MTHLTGVLADDLRPHVAEIVDAAASGNALAQSIIDTYRMHCASPGDPGAPALCQAYFTEWLKAKGAATDQAKDPDWSRNCHRA